MLFRSVKRDAPEQVPGKKADFELIKQGMAITTAGTTPWGTVQHILGPNYFPVRTGGKTGTAENPSGVDHAWYVGYAPADDPDIAVAVVVERGGSIV